MQVLEKVPDIYVFQELEMYASDNLFTEIHIILLVKAIVNIYMKIRLHHVATS